MASRAPPPPPPPTGKADEGGVGAAPVSYEEFLRRNQAWITPLEDFVRSATLFMPGRFTAGEAGLRGELTYTAVNLVSLYHDHVLDRHRVNLSDLRCGPQTPFIRRVKLTLTMLRNVQVVCEMFANRFFAGQPRKKWLVVLAIEAVKAACLLVLYHNNRSRMLITQSHERVTVLHEKKTSRALDARLRREAGEERFADLSRAYAVHGRGAEHPHGRWSEFTNPAKVPVDAEGERLYRRPPSLAMRVAELLHHLRPVVYAVARVAWPQSESWRPWLLSLAVDVAARAGIRGEQLSDAQRREVQRRNLMLLLYLVRSPVFEHFVRAPLEAAIDPFTRLPLVGGLFKSLLQMLLWLPRYHFYTSAS